MTGARITKIKRFLGDSEKFMLTYGDGVADIDIPKLLLFHDLHKKLVTVTGVHSIGRFGEMQVELNGEVTSFAEKPQVSEGRINGGFFVIKSKFIDKYLTEDESLVLEKYPHMQCAKDGQLMSYNHNGYWQPMDTYREYDHLNYLWNNTKAPWKIW
jgi:glucose-1-phosphate cytidylyltransferase